MSTRAGLSIAIGIAVVSASITWFLLSPSNESVIYDKAGKELANGRYAFAAKLLEQLAAAKPNDARVYLALARAYVGIDQIDKAWAAIGHAQQLGQGIIADPALTYQLANYYRQRANYERAAQLLAPLVEANTPGARDELSDLDAAWGDEQLTSNLEQALRCWEEVQSLNAGSRLQEAPARLASIYDRYSDKLIAQGDDKAALVVLNKLNSIAQNPAYRVKTAEVYERLGQLDLACDQLRNAVSLGGQSPDLKSRLAIMLSKYGEQLLDSGNTQEGYGYLQQANDMDAGIGLPSVVLKNVSVDVNPSDHHPQMTAEAWNAGTLPADQVKIQAHLVMPVTSRQLWQDTQMLVGQYDPPLAPQSSKPVRFDATTNTVRSDGSAAFDIYINNKFYKSYPLGKKSDRVPGGSNPVGSNQEGGIKSDSHLNPSNAANSNSNNGSMPNVVPSAFPAHQRQELTPEDQTLKDLER